MSRSTWKNRYYVDVYLLARSGHSDRQIAAALGLTRDQYAKRLRRDPELVAVVKRARSGGADENGNGSGSGSGNGCGNGSGDGQGRSGGRGLTSFQTYVYKQLHPDLQKLWDKIEFWWETENGAQRVESLLSQQTKQVRQMLWLHAMVNCDFNASLACRKLNIPYRVLKLWQDEDPYFKELLKELNFHLGEFFRSALIDLVAAREPRAVVHANKTFNREQFGDEVKVKHSGTVQHEHKHTFVPVDSLKLDLATRVKLLEAIQAAKPAQPAEAPRALPAHAVPVSVVQDDDEDDS